VPLLGQDLTSHFSASTFFQWQDSMLKLWSTRTSASLSGMLGVRTRYENALLPCVAHCMLMLLKMCAMLTELLLSQTDFYIAHFSVLFLNLQAIFLLNCILFLPPLSANRSGLCGGITSRTCKVSFSSWTVTIGIV
jgi:hypothetical protein